MATTSSAVSVPDHNVPVTTVPMPRKEKTRSTGMRVAGYDSRAGTSWPTRSSSASNSGNPSPVTPLTITIGEPA